MTTEFKVLNTGSISAAGSAEATWTPDRDIVLKKVLLVERGDASLSNVQVAIKIADRPFTRDFMPGSAIGQDLEYCWRPELKITKGTTIYFKVTNSTAAAINVDIVQELE